MSEEAPASPFIYRIGQLVRARGLDGEVQARLFRARPDASIGLSRRLDRPVSVELEWRDGRRRQLALRSAKFVDPVRVSLRFEGIEDRDAAEGLEGAFLDVDPRLPPDVLCDRIDRLFDVEVVDADSGAVLGRVDELRETGAHPLLVIGELMIPFVDAFIEGEEDERITVRLPPGLLEMNQG